MAFVAAYASGVLAQAPADPNGTTFDVVSVKRHAESASAGPDQRFSTTSRQHPDGGLTMLNVTPAILLSRAYSGAEPVDIAELPAWARSERYDLVATASLENPTEQRAAMLRAVLVDRFQLVAHVEDREQPVYDLIEAEAGVRSNGWRRRPEDRRRS